MCVKVLRIVVPLVELIIIKIIFFTGVFLLVFVGLLLFLSSLSLVYELRWCHLILSVVTIVEVSPSWVVFHTISHHHEVSWGLIVWLIILGVLVRSLVKLGA